MDWAKLGIQLMFQSPQECRSLAWFAEPQLQLQPPDLSARLGTWVFLKWWGGVCVEKCCTVVYLYIYIYMFI